MGSTIKLVIADDHEIFRDGLKLLFRNQNVLELVGEAEDGKQLIEVVDKHKPDVVITDIKMPVMDGIEACKILKQKHPALGIIALSMFNDDDLLIDMIEAGAKGYLLKNTNKKELLKAAKSVYQGGSYYCNATSIKFTRLVNSSSSNPYKTKLNLTTREKEIIMLICKQYSNKQIADELQLNIRTIESHREKIQEKIGSHNTAGIVLFAIRTKLYTLEEN
jgi:DNA-binding NarL/FixJ family response regulator